MGEKEIVSPKEIVSFEGIFSAAELFRLIDEWLLDKGYDRKEGKHTETIKPEGKYVELGLDPSKGLADYAKATLKIKITLAGIKDVIVTRDTTKQKMNQGKVTVAFEGILETDYEGRWEGKPIFLFIKILYDKFIYKTFTGGFETVIRQDVAFLKSQVKAYLNLQKTR